MSYPTYFDSKNSLNLFGLQENFNFISNLYNNKRLPKILMLTGNKGTGKSTLINHFLFSIFDAKNYNKEKFFLLKKSNFFHQFQNNIFSNIIYINGDDFKSVKIENIRSLRDKILQSTISNLDRFIVFDDIELFNNNSLNALLKIIEEPSKKNYFFLINNKSKPILETIRSRAVDINIILKENQRIEIINQLVSFFKLEVALNPKTSYLTPGNFIKFNHLCLEHRVSLEGVFLENLSLLLNLYKKNKNILFINLLSFIADFYFKDLKKKKTN